MMKKTFYGQFAGGENITELKPVVEKLANHGVRSMLNFSVEAADLGSSKGEAHCQSNLETILGVLESSKEVCEVRPYSSFKITGLTTPALLYQFTEVLEWVQRVFLENSQLRRAEQGERFMCSLSDKVRSNEELLVNRVMSREEFIALTNSSQLFEEADKDNVGTLDFQQFRDFVLSNPGVLQQIHGVPEVGEELVQGMKRLRARLEQIAEKTKSLDARIMIDAEQTYLQPAIDYFTLELMRKHNKGVAYVYNTYQCYLKKTPNTLTLDAMDAMSRGYNLGVKLVRGAYLMEETARAARLNYENPVQDTKTDTDRTYHEMLDVVLELVSRDHCFVLAGSHNEETVRYLMSRVDRLKLESGSEKVVFGQLYGLCDPTTFQLANSGYTVFKAIAWGRVEEVLPFLARRAEENTGVLGSTTRELDLLKMELWRRVIGE